MLNEIGIQSGSLFHHFKSKEDILKAVMTEHGVNVLVSHIRGRVGGLARHEVCALGQLICEHRDGVVSAFSLGQWAGEVNRHSVPTFGRCGQRLRGTAVVDVSWLVSLAGIATTRVVATVPVQTPPMVAT